MRGINAVVLVVVAIVGLICFAAASFKATEHKIDFGWAGVGCWFFVVVYPVIVSLHV